VILDDAGNTRVTFSLKTGETWNAPGDRIPVGARCTLAETDSAASDGITFTGENVVDNGDGTATVTPGTEPIKVEVTNAFGAGTMTLAKAVDGPGAGQWGAGPFTFDVTCTYREQTLFNGKVVLQPNGTRTLGPYPTGTTCTVVESGSAGATQTRLTPADGVIRIPKSSQDESTNVTVTATNTFDLTSLDVQKVVTGDLTADGAVGPFRVSLRCTWLVEGEQVPFAVPGGPERELSATNGYRASYDALPSSSVCTLTEVDDGGADSTSMQGVVSGARTSTTNNAITADLSATTGPGQALFTVTNDFVDSAVGGGGDNNGNGTGGLADTGGQAAPMLTLGLLWVVIGSAAVRLSAQRRS
jgi:hypothetical protein